MSTLSNNITQAVDDFDSIKEAIVEKGVDVPNNTPTFQYAEKIREISEGDMSNYYTKAETDELIRDFVVHVDKLNDGTITCDKTFNQIMEADQANKHVVCKFSDAYLGDQGIFQGTVNLYADKFDPAGIHFYNTKPSYNQLITISIYINWNDSISLHFDKTSFNKFYRARFSMPSSKSHVSIENGDELLSDLQRIVAHRINAYIQLYTGHYRNDYYKFKSYDDNSQTLYFETVIDYNVADSSYTQQSSIMVLSATLLDGQYINGEIYTRSNGDLVFDCRADLDSRECYLESVSVSLVEAATAIALRHTQNTNIMFNLNITSDSLGNFVLRLPCSRIVYSDTYEYDGTTIEAIEVSFISTAQIGSEIAVEQFGILRGSIVLGFIDEWQQLSSTFDFTAL